MLFIGYISDAQSVTANSETKNSSIFKSALEFLPRSVQGNVEYPEGFPNLHIETGSSVLTRKHFETLSPTSEPAEEIINSLLEILMMDSNFRRKKWIFCFNSKVFSQFIHSSKVKKSYLSWAKVNKLSDFKI